MRTKLLAAAAAGALALGIFAGPAQAKDGDVRKAGTCSGASTSKIKVAPRDGRLKTEFEVDSNVVGQTWTWTVSLNGAPAGSGSGTTAAPSGSFKVTRRLANQPGRDTVSAQATNPATGEVCTAVVSI